MYSNNRTRDEGDSLITTPREIPMTTACSLNFAIESCSDAIRFAIMPWQIPLENDRTAFPFDLWKYLLQIIKIYYHICWTLLWIMKLYSKYYTKLWANERHHRYHLSVQSACWVHPLLHLSSLIKFYKFCWCSLFPEQRMTRKGSPLWLKQRGYFEPSSEMINIILVFAIEFKFSHGI